ncbi:MAG: hypothetical protein IAE93_15000 [Ignavibacteria bacterium]|nr:hypothetical protein [Ignavibacteria bacterium]
MKQLIRSKPEKGSAGDSLKNSNLVQLLKVFSREEKTEFGKFVHSPLNPRNETARFYDCLKKYFPNFEDINFNRQTVFAELYPGKKFSDAVIRRNTSNLLKLAEDFIAFRELKEDQIAFSNLVTDYYLRKDPGNLFLRKAGKARLLLDENPQRNENYYYRLEQLNTSIAYYYSKEDATRKKFDNTPERIEQTWQFAIHALLSVYGAAVNDMLYFNKEYDIELLKPLMNIYKSKAFKRNNTTEVLYYCIKLSTDGRNDETFYRLLELLEESSSLFSKAELFGFYISLHNYAYERSLDPKNEIWDIEFKIAERMLELGLITENGKITSEWFVNTFIKAIRASKLEFAENFIEDYREMLPKAERENVVNTSRAELAFTRKDYVKALEYLAKVKFNNTWDKLRVNHMYVKIHYEMNNPELFYYITDSFKHFLKDEPSINDFIKKTFGNFLNYTIQVFKMRSGEEKPAGVNLRKKILNSQISGNKWLLEKLNELTGE